MKISSRCQAFYTESAWCLDDAALCPVATPAGKGCWRVSVLRRSAKIARVLTSHADEPILIRWSSDGAFGTASGKSASDERRCIDCRQVTSPYLLKEIGVTLWYRFAAISAALL